MNASSAIPIRVLHLLPDFDLGGGQVVLRQTIGALQGPEWQHIVVAFGGGPLLGPYREDGIRCEMLSNHRTTDWPAAFGRLVQLVRSEDVDVIVSLNTPLDRTMAQLCAVVTRRPVVVWFMSMAIRLLAFPPPLRRTLAFFKRLALYPFNYSSVRLLAAHVANSEATAQSFADHLRLSTDRFEIVPPGLPQRAFDHSLTDAERYELRGRLGLHDAFPVLLNVGMLIPLKGQLHLIETLERLTDEFPDAHLLLVGEGPDRPVLESRIADSSARDRIHLLGHRTDVQDLLRISDTLVTASRSEGFGLSVLEGMASALPVVGVRTPAFLEFLEEGVTAELVDDQDAEQLARAVRAVFTDPARAASMGALARERALEYRVDLRAAAFGDVLRSVATRSKRRPQRSG